MAEGYLRYFPKPLLDDLLADHCLPVIGAGLSRNAILPSGSRMPLWLELGELISGDLDGFTYSGRPIEALSAFASRYGRPRLTEKLAEYLYIGDAIPSDSHKAFCSLPFDLVCTTNIDFLLEGQYHSLSRHCTPVMDEAQLSVNPIRPGVTLLKLHGDVHHPNRLVVTQSDYASFHQNYPLMISYVTTLLVRQTAVFIGYSLSDPDFWQIWQSIGDRLHDSRRTAYSIMVAPDAREVDRLKQSGVNVISLPGPPDQYGQTLTDAFTELRDYWQSQGGLRPPPAKERYHSMTIKPEARTAIVTIKDGNVYVNIPPENYLRQLTSSGTDSDPRISPDGEFVVYVRSTPDCIVETALGESEATEIWTIKVDGTEARKRVQGIPWATPEMSLSGFHNPQFTPDGRLIYFLSTAWVTSAAVHAVDLETGKENFVCSGNSLEVITSGQYTGHLIVNQHRYFLGGGSYDWFWLIAPDGQVVGPIGESIDSFREVYISQRGSD